MMATKQPALEQKIREAEKELQIAREKREEALRLVQSMRVE